MVDPVLECSYLSLIEGSPRYARWLYDAIKPFVKGDILEVGSGVGTYSQFLYNEFAGTLCLTDINEAYVNKLRRRFPDDRVLHEKLDLGSPEDFKMLRDRKLLFDTIICMNVLEHVEDDDLALREMISLLKDGGALILLVPVHKSLYNSIDKAVGHFRRYTKSELVSRLTSTGLRISKIFYFDAFGIVGWYVNGNILKKQAVNPKAFGFFDKLVPILRFLEDLLPFRITGVSVVAVCVNPVPHGHDK